MPFEPTHQLGPDPFVRIYFIGLNILAPADNATCQAFVHNLSDDHHLLIEVRQKRRGKPDLVRMRRQGPLIFIDNDPENIHGLSIVTTGVPADRKGVKAYIGAGSSEGTSLSDSFRLDTILDVSPGEVDPDGGLPGISIDHGILYTADKQIRKAKLIKKNGLEKRRGEVPRIIGANIYKPADVTLIWRQNEHDEHDMHLRLDPDFTHEIYVMNEPFFDPDSPDSPKHDEFARYFEILPDVPEHEHYSLELADPERGSTRNPCMSVLLSE